MKKLIFIFCFISSFTFGQVAITLTPNGIDNTEFLKLKKGSRGLDHSSIDNLVGIGTHVTSSGLYFQTHTNTPLSFATNSGLPQITITNDGKVGIGTSTPHAVFEVEGNILLNGNFTTPYFKTQSLNIGSGSVIEGLASVLLTNQEIPSVPSKSCINHILSFGSVVSNPNVILNIESPFSTLTVENCKIINFAQTEVKLCNVGLTDSPMLTDIDMRLTMIY